MNRDRKLRATFNEVAKIYDEIRPGYPEQLIEDVLSLSGIPKDGRILEVGCGPGKATIPFAKRGYRMLCLELGEDLAALAIENCRLYPNVDIQTTTFEDWPLQKKSFDLVFSAQAFHWISPEIGYAKTAAALLDSGSIALFLNHQPRPNTTLFRDLHDVYQKRAPQIMAHGGTIEPEDTIRKTAAEISASGYFGEVTVRRYAWSREYSTEGYIKLLSTYSDHRNLEEIIRNNLFAGVREVIEQHGGTILKPYLAVLYQAKVK